MATEYVVFRLTDKQEWEFVGNHEAASSKSAIQAALNGPATEFERSGTFVATPKRSWQPVKVRVETALKFS
jgi:hypothetical protein